MLGNLQVFEGPDALNAYAAFLRDMPMALWSARLTLLAIVRPAYRPVRSVWRFRTGARVPSATRSISIAVPPWRPRTMTLTGSLLVLFIVFHLHAFDRRLAGSVAP